jgi:hypothetical protein
MCCWPTGVPEGGRVQLCPDLATRRVMLISQDRGESTAESESDVCLDQSFVHGEPNFAVCWPVSGASSKGALEGASSVRCGARGVWPCHCGAHACQWSGERLTAHSTPQQSGRLPDTHDENSTVQDPLTISGPVNTVNPFSRLLTLFTLPQPPASLSVSTGSAPRL